MKKIIWLVVILFCIFSVNIVVCCLDVGLWISEYIPDHFHRVFIDQSRVFEVTEYLDLWFSVLSIIITAILSWLLLKVSRKSNEISEKISCLEESRDAKIINDTISFVYYQIVHSFKDLHELYCDYFIFNKTNDRQIKIHTDWITALSKLQSVLSISEIDSIYQFFVDIETVNTTTCDQKLVVKEIYQKYMLPCFFDTQDFLDWKKIDPLTMLHPNMLSIIIFLLFSFKKTELLIEDKNSKYIISETDNNWFNGEIELSKNKFSGNINLSYKNLKLKGKFFENRFLSGEIKAYYENTFKNLYEIQYKSNTNFHVKLYNIEENSCTGELVVNADYTNNIFDVGFLIYKSCEELWKGIIKLNKHNFEMIDGVIYHRLVEDSIQNYNYDEEQRFIEVQYEQQNDPQYIEHLMDEINQEQPIGHKVYEDFIYKNGKLVERKNPTTVFQYAES